MMDERSKVDGVDLDQPAAADTLKSAATDVKHALQDAASNLTTTAKEQTGALKDKALSAIGDAQGKAAEQAKTAASTLRDTANGLDGDLPWMGTALTKAADGLDHLTSALASGDLNDALDAVKGFAKRQPAVFLGLSVALGFAIARVGKTAIETVQPPVQPTSNGVGLTTGVGG